MKKYFLLLLSITVISTASAQQVEVPDNVYFADQHLKIQESGRKEIQKMVDALHRHPVYFQQKVDLADMYFPIIERIFNEEGIPEDFKYLSLQESGLQSDAVSKSNAVGYWQFKREAASDFSLQINNYVDERKHIIASTRGAAQYFKRSNATYQNWTNTLLTYYLGPTGAKSVTKSSDTGSKKMVITDKTHQYILTFLAHKIAYENFVGKSSLPPVTLQEINARPGQSLSEIALNTKTDPAEVERYNKWLSGNTIPNDKSYIVLLPVNNRSNPVVVASAEPVQNPTVINTETTGLPSAEFTSKNNLKAVIARPGDTKDKLALAAGISTRKFLKYNDLHSFEPIKEGNLYYTEKKHSQAHVEFHTVEKGEDLQAIAQKYGVKEKSIRYKNRLAKNEVLLEGRLLWMQSRRPKHVRVEYRRVTNNVAQQNNTPAKKKGFFTKVGEFLGITPHETEVAEVEMDSVLEAENTEDETDENLADINTSDSVEAQEIKPTVAATAKPGQAVATQTAAYPSKKTTSEKTQILESSTVQAEDDTEEEMQKVKAVIADKKVAESTTVKEAAIISKPVKTENTTSKTTQSATSTESTVPLQKPKAVTPNTATANNSVVKPETTVNVKASKQTKHTVVKGETLYSISKNYNVTVADLKEWNNLKDLTLALGQQLNISKPETTAKAIANTTPTSAVPATHTVITGETLYGISSKYNISIQDLQTWNKLENGAVNVGQELILAAPAATSTTPLIKETASKPTSGEVMYHTVSEGESMYQISRKYNVTIKDIMDWNRKPDFNVSQGERLLIKPKSASN